MYWKNHKYWIIKTDLKILELLKDWEIITYDQGFLKSTPSKIILRKNKTDLSLLFDRHSIWFEIQGYIGKKHQNFYIAEWELGWCLSLKYPKKYSRIPKIKSGKQKK